MRNQRHPWDDGPVHQIGAAAARCSSTHPAPVQASDPRTVPHRWVAASLVDVGNGEHDQRAERAARTGWYTVPATTRIEVLEVYCAHCRVPYHPLLAGSDCPAQKNYRSRSDRGLRPAQ